MFKNTIGMLSEYFQRNGIRCERDSPDSIDIYYPIDMHNKVTFGIKVMEDGDSDSIIFHLYDYLKLPLSSEVINNIPHICNSLNRVMSLTKYMSTEDHENIIFGTYRIEIFDPGTCCGMVNRILETMSGEYEVAYEELIDNRGVRLLEI